MRTGEREHRRDRRTGIVRAALAALLVASAAAAQQDGPQVSVTLDPEGAVTVGTPIEVTATVLVPTYMPKPPVWPELQIADAITRLPERATQPLTRRIGTASWSGLSRTWEIIPQRAADYDLGAPEIAIAYADPDTGKPVESRLAMPDIAFSATVPPGATGMDPFLPASALKLSATLDGLPKNPCPGDAFTLTLTAAAVGPPAILLPPLGAGIATPVGLRAYPEESALTDVPGDRGGPPTATRTEQVTYVIEAPGDFTLPGLSLDWWNTATSKLSPVLSSAILHHRFESIHPFADGNGRTGRALALWELYRRGFDTHHIFSVDEFYWEDRPRYYAELDAVRLAGDDLTSWLEYSAEGLRQTLERAWLRIQAIRGGAAKKLALRPRQEQLLHLLRDHGSMAPNEIWSALGVSRQGAMDLLRPLLEAGLVEKVGGAKTGHYVLKDARF